MTNEISAPPEGSAPPVILAAQPIDAQATDPVDTGVLTAGQCGEQTARNLTRQIQKSLDQTSRSLEMACDLIREAYSRRVWISLGYSSWQDYCAAELEGAFTRLERALRQRAVAELTSGDRPLSARATGAALGVDHSTVLKDQAHLAQVVEIHHLTESDSGEVVDADIVEEPTPRSVVGTDGKTYTNRRPRPVPMTTSPDRLAKEWRAAEIALTKATKKLKDLVQAKDCVTQAANLAVRDDLRLAAQRIAAVQSALDDALPEAEDA